MRTKIKKPLPSLLHNIFGRRSLREQRVNLYKDIFKLVHKVMENNNYTTYEELFLEYIKQNPPTDTEWVDILIDTASTIDERYEIIEMMADEAVNGCPYCRKKN